MKGSIAARANAGVCGFMRAVQTFVGAAELGVTAYEFLSET